MKTQVSVLVKNESIVSRFFTFLWFVNIFKKMPVDMHIDTEANVQRLKASSQPYLIDVEPGSHQILFTDPRAKTKATFSAVTGAVVGAAFSAGAGGSVLGGAALGADAVSDNTVRNGVVSCHLNEGDVLELMVKPKRNGSVKVKIINKK
ncbi:MAG: hypothetical protein LUH07_03770 [Lachnospiraceae bacterium]|nr:hypothetical protein [Lachnospiraceae bacterium]